MSRKRRTERRSLATWLMLGTVMTTLSAVVTVTVLQLVTGPTRPDFPEHGKRLVLAVAFLSVALVVGTVSALFNWAFNHCVSQLTHGLKAVAEGDFSIRLDPERAGPLAGAYQDFNKMTEGLQGVQTLRSDFINNFSHEFKTPITAVKGFAELLQEGDITPEEREEYLQIILDESARLADLANSTLLLSKLESQQYLSNKKVFLLDEQIKRCAILLSPSWEQKGLVFSADLEPARCCGSEELLRHVWLNLLGNAVKYTPEGGEISVALRAGPETVLVQVSDTGIGMSEEVQGHVFEKYYQGEQGQDGKGLGLGLSIVHRIVELHGGTISVTSEEGTGSTFSVLLPIVPDGGSRPA